jgi:hypothetical protein
MEKGLEGLILFQLGRGTREGSWRRTTKDPLEGSLNYTGLISVGEARQGFERKDGQILIDIQSTWTQPTEVYK